MLGFCWKYLGFCWNFRPLSNSTSLYFSGCLVFLWNTLVRKVVTGAICLKNYLVLLSGEAAWKGRHLSMILTIADGLFFMYMQGKVIWKGYVHFSVFFLLSHSEYWVFYMCVFIYIYWFIVPLTLSMWFGLVIFLCELPLHFPFCILLVYEYVFSCEENPECLSIPFKKPNVEFFFNFCKL